MARACPKSVRPAWVGVTPWRERTRSAAPSACSMLRMRVEAAASARCARSAPCVMLPASTTWRNKLRSARSKCIALPSYPTKVRYAKCSLKATFLEAIFVAGEALLGGPGASRARLTGMRSGAPPSHPPDHPGLRPRRTLVRNTAGERRPRRQEDDDGRHRRSRAAALSPHADLSLAVTDDDVDRASDHRRRPLFRHTAAGVVASCGRPRA